MSLPPLHLLRIPNTVCNVAADQEEDPHAEKDSGAVTSLVKRAMATVVREIPNAPLMLCVQDKNATSLQSARDVLIFLKQHRNTSAGTRKVFDDKEDEQRYKAAIAEGKQPSRVTLFQPSLVYRHHGVRVVKDRLIVLVHNVALALKAKVWIGDDALQRAQGMGWSISYNDKYGTEIDNYRFHQDAPETHPSFENVMPRNSGWIMLTLVYYLLDPTDEPTAAQRVGQGSTLYNFQGTKEPNGDTPVAFCKLANGSISILDSSRWHAVGPNYGIGRGAVVLKVVLYKPLFPIIEKYWSHEEWWTRAQAAMLRLACDPRNGFGLMPHGQASLCDVVQPPNLSPL